LKKQIFYDKQVALFRSQFIDAHTMTLYTNTNPIRIGQVEEHTKKGLLQEVVEKTNRFAPRFLKKHYARSLEDAEKKIKENEDFQVGRTTIIKISSETVLDRIVKESLIPSNYTITPTSAWEFYNGEFKGVRENPDIIIDYDQSNKIYHLCSVVNKQPTAVVKKVQTSKPPTKAIKV
jgi:hypothetical protein